MTHVDVCVSDLLAAYHMPSVTAGNRVVLEKLLLAFELI